MTGTIPLLILALLLLAIFLWIGIRNNQQDRGLKQKLGESLGLHPLTRINQDLTRQIITLHRPGQNHRLALRNVFSGALPEGDLYLFDLWESRNGYRGYAEQCAFAVISSRANLPRMSLFPRSKVPGKPGGPLSAITSWLVSPLEPEIHSGDPGFDERYLLTGKDESAIRAVLKPALIEYLDETPPLLLRAYEHTLTVSVIDSYNGQKRPDLETVSALHNQATRISSILFG